jgi:hypothetical protein
MSIEKNRDLMIEQIKRLKGQLNEDKTPKSSTQLKKAKKELHKYKNMRAGEGNMIPDELWEEFMQQLSFIV